MNPREKNRNPRNDKDTNTNNRDKEQSIRDKDQNTKTSYKDGKLKEAVNYAKEAIKFSKNDFGINHYYTATLIENLGIIQYELSMYEDAKDSFVEVLNIRKTSLNEDHIDIAESLNYIALTNRKLYQYDDAISYLKGLGYFNVVDIKCFSLNFSCGKKKYC